MEHLSSDMEQHHEQLQWRRDKIQELCSKGYNQRGISQILQIGLATVNRDIMYLRNQAKANIRRYIDERLPEEYEKCLVGLNAITKEAWNTAQQTEDKREKIQALSLVKECYGMKLELLTNATVVDDAIRFVASSKQKGYHQQQQILSEGKEKAKDNCRAIENQYNNSNDIQGSEEENQQQQCRRNGFNNKPDFLTYVKTSHSGSGTKDNTSNKT